MARLLVLFYCACWVLASPERVDILNNEAAVELPEEDAVALPEQDEVHDSPDSSQGDRPRLIAEGDTEDVDEEGVPNVGERQPERQDKLLRTRKEFNSSKRLVQEEDVRTEGWEISRKSKGSDVRRTRWRHITRIDFFVPIKKDGPRIVEADVAAPAIFAPTPGVVLVPLLPAQPTVTTVQIPLSVPRVETVPVDKPSGPIVSHLSTNQAIESGRVPTDALQPSLERLERPAAPRSQEIRQDIQHHQPPLAAEPLSVEKSVEIGPDQSVVVLDTLEPTPQMLPVSSLPTPAVAQPLQIVPYNTAKPNRTYEPARVQSPAYALAPQPLSPPVVHPEGVVVYHHSSAIGHMSFYLVVVQSLAIFLS